MIFSKKQQSVIESVVSLLTSKDKQYITLTGSAGTGKSSITAEIVKQLNAKNYVFTLCAPTNKAKMILEGFTGRQANTVHSLLKLKPQLEIQNLDYGSLNFMFPDLQIQKGILIVDEASMVNDDLHKFLCDKYEKILAIGDSKQLLPVGQDTFSKFFTDSKVFELTEIFRQVEDSPLIDVLSKLRDTTIDVFVENYNEKGGIKLVSSPGKLVSAACEEIKESWSLKEPQNTAILAYTNKAVDSYNDKVRKTLGFNKELVVGERLLARDNFDAGVNTIINSLEYQVIAIKECPRFQLGFSLPAIHAYTVTITDHDIEFTINIMSKENNSDEVKAKIASKAENLRISAMKHRKGTIKYTNAWKDYFRFMKLFTTLEDLKIENRIVKKATFKYGYAKSVHLSQGCSLGSVYIDMKNINTCRSEVERRQLQYVAASRTRKMVTIYQ